jgi:hypothetical protein
MIWWIAPVKRVMPPLVRFWRALGTRSGLTLETKKANKHKCLLAHDLRNEAEGSRTLNLRIDSPML